MSDGGRKNEDPLRPSRVAELKKPAECGLFVRRDYIFFRSPLPATVRGGDQSGCTVHPGATLFPASGAANAAAAASNVG